MTPSGSLPQSTFSLPPVSLVLGGAKSGKSRLAEKLVTLSGRTRAYVATAQAFDDEMRLKINQHREDRGPDWLTLEAPTDIRTALEACGPDHAVLLDCATLWLTNVMLAGDDLAQASRALIQTLDHSPCPVVVVSNEVGWSIVPENRMARQFRDAQGRLNQMLAARSDLVLGVMAGLPIVLKGSLPEGTL